MKKKIIIGAVVVVVLCATLIPWLLGNRQLAQAMSSPVMEMEQLVMGNIRLTISLIGKIEPSGMVYIYPKASGGVTTVSIKAGDIVAQGRAICTTDIKQMKTTKSSMDPAGLSLEQAREELARQQILHSSGGISDREYGQHRDNVISAEISYNQAKYSREAQMEYSQITMPIDGLVEICGMEPYDTVSQSSLIRVISRRGSRAVSSSATEGVHGHPQEGDITRVEKDGGSCQGTIHEISTIVDETTGLYKVKTSTDENTFSSTGSEVKLYTTSEEITNAMIIPVNVVYYEDGEPYVYIYTNGKAHKRDIENGIYGSNTMEARSGLALNDQVVATRSSESYERAEVVLKNQEEGEQ